MWHRGHVDLFAKSLWGASNCIVVHNLAGRTCQGSHEMITRPIFRFSPYYSAQRLILRRYRARDAYTQWYANMSTEIGMVIGIEIAAIVETVFFRKSR